MEQIAHDIAVLDVAVYLHRVKCIAFEQMTTEKQLHSLDGFGVRRHRPDFVISKRIQQLEELQDTGIQAESPPIEAPEPLRSEDCRLSGKIPILLQRVCLVSFCVSCIYWRLGLGNTKMNYVSTAE